MWKFTINWVTQNTAGNRIRGWCNTTVRAITLKMSIQCRKHVDSESFQLNYCWKFLFYAKNLYTHLHSTAFWVFLASNLCFSFNVGDFLPLVPGTPPSPFCPFIPGPPICPFLPVFPQWPFMPTATNTTLLQFTLPLLVPEALCPLDLSGLSRIMEQPHKFTLFPQFYSFVSN